MEIAAKQKINRMKQRWRQASVQDSNSSVARPWKLEHWFRELYLGLKVAASFDGTESYVRTVDGQIRCIRPEFKLKVLNTAWNVLFFCRRPLPFGGSPLETYPWTSGESNHHRQSVRVAKTNALPTEPRGHLTLHGMHTT